MTRIYTNILKDQEEDVYSPAETPGDLLDRVGALLIHAGLRRQINWQEAEYVYLAVLYRNEREELNWRRQQEIIAMGGLPRVSTYPPADRYPVSVDPASVPPN